MADDDNPNIVGLTNTLTFAINNPEPILIIKPDGLVCHPDGRTLSDLSHFELRTLVLKLCECMSGKFHPHKLRDGTYGTAGNNEPIG